jgi:hypothetical protein
VQAEAGDHQVLWGPSHDGPAVPTPGLVSGNAQVVGGGLGTRAAVMNSPYLP